MDRSQPCHASMSVHPLVKPLLTYKIVENPSTEMTANHDGVIRVGSRMKWYCELANLLLKEDTTGAKMSAGLRHELEQRLIDLYQALLLFLIRSVGYCFRNRFIATARDLLMWENWSGALASIEAAESGFRQDKNDYNTEIIRLTTEDIGLTLQKHLEVALRQEDSLRSNLNHVLKNQEVANSLLQQQVSQQASDKLEEKDEEFIDLLCLSDPQYDQKRIETSKGGLLEASYDWILEDFNQWRDDKQSRLLWIEGSPGKGKTMLLCGIMKELSKSTTSLLSYFFCQASDERINNATAVMQGVLFMLVDQQPWLISNARKKHRIRKTLSGSPNACFTLSGVFKDFLRDPSLKETYVIIDALDECIAELPILLELIMQESSESASRIKWIVSSRSNNADIERTLRLDGPRMKLSLDEKDYAEQVARVVDAYIDRSVCKLAKDNKYDEFDKALQGKVRDEMRQKANGTFLWVSLVNKSLEKVKSWSVLDLIDKMPSDLIDLYQRMLDQIQALEDRDPERCRLVLSTVITAKEPLRLEELGILSGLPKEIADKKNIVAEVVNMCGSFLTIQYESVYIVHKSANDFLRKQGLETIFPSGTNDVHYKMFSASIHTLLKTLKRDMYGLEAPGFLINEVKRPDLDPLAAARYGCVYWVDHLYDSGDALGDEDFRNESDIDKFMREKYLYWLEALSLCRSMSKGVVSMAKLEALSQVIHSSALVNNIC
jgi:Cdc6-like AAA superfamily ATPase